jgi:hypothetical protein
MATDISTKPFALVGFFDTPAQLYSACEKLRDGGYKKFDAHTPFAVHGLERAMGVGPSRLPWIVLGCGMLGFLAGVGMQWWTMAVDYPLNIAGKALFPWQAYVPITFETTVLLSAFGCFFGMWGLNRLPTYFHPVMQHPSFHRATDDKFFIAVEAVDPHYDSSQTRKLLEEAGAQELVEVQP